MRTFRGYADEQILPFRILKPALNIDVFDLENAYSYRYAPPSKLRF